jgi:SAM-dependent methyltransferase
MTPDQSEPPDLFDRQRRCARRALIRGEDFVGGLIIDALLDRLAAVMREFSRALILGGRSAALVDALQARGMTVECAEPDGSGRGLGSDPDRLDVVPGSYDLILWPGGLESINDVPAALLRARLALRPDGLLLGAVVGDGSLPQLRAALKGGATMTGGAIAARMHPQISLQALGDLLGRTGFALPVVDVDAVTLRYRTIAALVRDLRAGALTATLAGPVPPLSRALWAATGAAFAEAAVDGATIETLRIIHFSGWAPDASQPQPARRGSATASLAAALRQGGDQR